MGIVKGQIYRVHTNSYLVKTEDGVLPCKAKGIFKKHKQNLLVGDYVTIENGVISSVSERKNTFIRPSVSNVDVVVLIISPEPKPDFYLIDKVLINSVKEDVKVIFAINKQDLNNSNIYEKITNEYKLTSVEVLPISAKTGDGVEQLKQKLKGKVSVLCGQSAVGKTTLINAMFNLDLKTGDLSSIGRGKHTTTRSEIFEYDNVKLVDSPGFSVIDALVTKEELPECYEEYLNVSGECKFRGCSHIDEPNCRVKELVLQGVYSVERYNRYVEIYSEIKRRKVYERD